MKKINILMPLIATSTLAIASTPLVSCNDAKSFTAYLSNPSSDGFNIDNTKVEKNTEFVTNISTTNSMTQESLSNVLVAGQALSSSDYTFVQETEQKYKLTINNKDKIVGDICICMKTGQSPQPIGEELEFETNLYIPDGLEIAQEPTLTLSNTKAYKNKIFETIIEMSEIQEYPNADILVYGIYDNVEQRWIHCGDGIACTHLGQKKISLVIDKSKMQNNFDLSIHLCFPINLDTTYPFNYSLYGNIDDNYVQAGKTNQTCLIYYKGWDDCNLSLNSIKMAGKTLQNVEDYHLIIDNSASCIVITFKCFINDTITIDVENPVEISLSFQQDDLYGISSKQDISMVENQKTFFKTYLGIWEGTVTDLYFASSNGNPDSSLSNLDIFVDFKIKLNDTWLVEGSDNDYICMPPVDTDGEQIQYIMFTNTGIEKINAAKQGGILYGYLVQEETQQNHQISFISHQEI